MTNSGRELALMLAGKKALAAFCRHNSERFDETGGQDFQRYLASGQIKCQRFFVRDQQGNNLIYTLYFTPGSEWRAEMYRSLKKSIGGGWSKSKEILESILLDYDTRDIASYINLLK